MGPRCPSPIGAACPTFDDLFHSCIQRQFRAYLASLLLPRDLNETPMARAEVGLIVQAQTAPVQRLQGFLTRTG